MKCKYCGKEIYVKRVKKDWQFCNELCFRLNSLYTKQEEHKKALQRQRQSRHYEFN